MKFASLFLTEAYHSCSKIIGHLWCQIQQLHANHMQLLKIFKFNGFGANLGAKVNNCMLATCNCLLLAQHLLDLCFFNHFFSTLKANYEQLDARPETWESRGI